MADPTDKDKNEPLDPIWKVLNELKAFWQRQPRTLKTAIVAVGVLIIGAVAAILTMEHTDYKTLYSNLTPEDAASIIDHIKGNKIEYKYEEAGGRVSVPSEHVHDLRLELATQGLPTGGGVGFELFDEQRFGMTEFEERLALRRALEGELSRTITRLDVIKNAKVHLVLVKRSLLGSQKSPAQGSVVVELHRGRELSGGMIQSIVHLVSSSVEGLTPDRVTVVDTHGKLLSSDTAVGAGGGKELEYKKKYETDIQHSIQEMLEQLLGPGESITRVSAELDFNQTETTAEHYDPEKSAVRSERRETESTGSQSLGAGGIPGTRSNLPGGEAPSQNNTSSNSKKEMETKNYEIDRVVSKTVGPGALLKKISVAVLVDGINKEGEPFKPRSKADLKKIELAVRGAIGYNKQRGDFIEVQSISFHEPEPLNEEAIKPPFPWKEYLPIAVGVLVVLFAFLALFTFRKKATPTTAVATGGGALPAGATPQALPLPRPVHELETMLEQQPGQLPGEVVKPSDLNLPDLSVFQASPELDAYAAQASDMLAQVKSIFEDDSETAARIIKTWLNEPSRAASAETEQV